MSETKKCAKCGLNKPVTDFYGNDTACKECRRKKIEEARARTKARKLAEQAAQAPEIKAVEQVAGSPIAPVVDAPIELPEPQTVTQAPALPEPRPQSFAITIDFADFPGALEQLEQQARSEVRSVEGQALWILKGALDLRSIRRTIALETAN